MKLAYTLLLVICTHILVSGYARPQLPQLPQLPRPEAGPEEGPEETTGGTPEEGTGEEEGGLGLGRVLGPLFRRFRAQFGSPLPDALGQLLPDLSLPRLDPQLLHLARGPCPDVTVISEFEKERYYGLWYEIARYPVIYEYKSKCVTAEYSSSRFLRKYIKVENTGIKEDTGEKTEATGRAYIPDENEPGKLAVSFDNLTPAIQALAGFFPEDLEMNEDKSNYWIIDTDYDTYSLVHSCMEWKPAPQLPRFHSMSNWILSRTPNPDNATFVQPALARFEEFGIPLDVFHFTDQTNCVAEE